jgi:casein kinase II subunit beta
MDLYGLIHARFILSPYGTFSINHEGLELMKEKYLKGDFGTCPRVKCDKQNALPCGVSEELSVSRVKVSYFRNL